MLSTSSDSGTSAEEIDDIKVWMRLNQEGLDWASLCQNVEVAPKGSLSHCTVTVQTAHWQLQILLTGSDIDFGEPQAS